MLNKRYDGDYPTVQGALPREAQYEAPKMVLVDEFMSKKLISVGPDADAMDVVNLLSQHRITGVPVVDDAGHLLGVVSEKDTFKLILNGGFNQSLAGKVSDIMSQEVVTIKPSDDVFMVANLFYKSNFRRLPVVDDGKVVGMVSRRDVLECIKEMGH
jgi:CBS domain-containing protein